MADIKVLVMLYLKKYLHVITSMINLVFIICTMFFSIPVTSGVGFVASVTSGLICLGLLIFSNNIELTVLTLLDEN